MHLFICLNSPYSLQTSLGSKYLPRTAGLRGKNLQTARKDFVTRLDLGEPEQRNVFKALSLVCRRWFHHEFWDESPPGWLEQRPRWLCRAGSAAQGLLCCSPFPGNFRERPFPPLRSVPSVLLRWHLRALPRAGRAGRGVLAVCAARGWPLLSPCHTKGSGTGAQGRGGCSAMASPAVAAGKGDGSCCSGDIPPLPYSGGVRRGWKSRDREGMEWPIPTCVPAQCCHSSLTRVWVALKAASTCHRNQSGHFTCSPFCAYLCL